MNDVLATPVLAEETINRSTVTLEDAETDVTVTITEELTMREEISLVISLAMSP